MSRHDEDLALLTDWFEEHVPHGATLRWGDNHVNTGPEHVLTGWVDVQIPAIENDLHWSWVWTVVGPEDEEADLSGLQIACDYDTSLWRAWDPDAHWWDDEFYVLTTPGAELPDGMRSLFDVVPGETLGWTADAVSAALSRWCAETLSRPDITFVFDDTISSADIEVVVQIMESIKNGEETTYEMAPGIRASTAVMDFLLGLDVDEAADVSHAIVEQMSQVRELYMNDPDEAEDLVRARWGTGPEFQDVREWECEVCEKHLLASAADAHALGWDTPPYFQGYVKCDECPIDKTAIWAMWSSDYGTDGPT